MTRSTFNGNALPAPLTAKVRRRWRPHIFHQMQVIEHDVQTSLGMFKAAVGETESQQSGRAILALQRESDTGTYHFSANQSISIRHAGRIILDLIPHYYDTKRIVRILGEDGEMQSAQIDPSQDVAHRQIQTPGGIKAIYNPSLGKYDVSITVGPSYNTKRMESAATFVELAKGASDPGSAAVLRYLTVRNSDFPGSDEAAKMLRALLPPQVAAVIGDKDPVPKLIAQLTQMQQGMKQMQEAGQKLQEENMKLKAGIPQAQIKAQAEQQIESQRMQFEAQAQARELQMKAAADERERRMEAIARDQEMRQEAMLARFEALLKANTAVEVAEISAGATVSAAQIAAAPSGHNDTLLVKIAILGGGNVYALNFARHLSEIGIEHFGIGEAGPSRSRYGKSIITTDSGRCTSSISYRRTWRSSTRRSQTRWSTSPRKGRVPRPSDRTHTTTTRRIRWRS
jgi:hypothetical protein